MALFNKASPHCAFKEGTACKMFLLFVLKRQYLYIATEKEEILLKLQGALAEWTFWIFFLQSEAFPSLLFQL